MKICKTCKTHYVDDTLSYCLQDGSTLDAAPITETPTVILGETETVISPRPRGNAPTSPARLSTPPWSNVAGARKSNTGLAVLLTALGMLVIFGIVGLGAWLYLKGDDGEIAKNSNSRPDSGRNINSKTTPSSTPAPPVVNSATPAPPPPSVVNPEEVRRDVAKTIMTWKSMAESLDLDSHMGNYADTVDYYRKNGADRAFVRRDRQRAFTRFHSISIDITNLNITPGATGQDAIATFDKAWNFEGKKRFSGSVRQQLKLRNFNGEWLITSEKDL